MWENNKHKLRYFWWNPRAFWPCIDSNVTTTFNAQKGSKCYSHEHALKAYSEENKLLNKVVILFSLQTKSILVAS